MTTTVSPHVTCRTTSLEAGPLTASCREMSNTASTTMFNIISSNNLSFPWMWNSIFLGCVWVWSFSLLFLDYSEISGKEKPRGIFSKILESKSDMGIQILMWTWVLEWLPKKISLFAKTNLMFKDKPLKRQYSYWNANQTYKHMVSFPPPKLCKELRDPISAFGGGLSSDTPQWVRMCVKSL